MLIRQLLKLTRTLFLSESKKMDTSGQSSFTVWTEAKPPLPPVCANKPYKTQYWLPFSQE